MPETCKHHELLASKLQHINEKGCDIMNEEHRPMWQAINSKMPMALGLTLFTVMVSTLGVMLVATIAIPDKMHKIIQESTKELTGEIRNMSNELRRVVYDVEELKRARREGEKHD